MFARQPHENRIVRSAHCFAGSADESGSAALRPPPATKQPCRRERLGAPWSTPRPEFDVAGRSGEAQRTEASGESRAVDVVCDEH
jgi:hypothetical protein